MTITFVGSNETSLGSNNNRTVTLPAHQEDDLAIVYAVHADSTNNDTTISGATGWTELVDEALSGGVLSKTAIFYKVLQSGSETDPTVNWSSTSSSDSWASIHVFRGVDTSTPIDTTYSGIADSTSGTTHDPQNSPIVTVTDNAAVFLTASTELVQQDGTFTAPAGYTLGEEEEANAVAYLLDVGAAGTETPGAWSISTSLSNNPEWTLYTMALRPGASILQGTGTASVTAALAASAITPDLSLKTEGPWHLPPGEFLLGGTVATITGTALPGGALVYSSEGNLYFQVIGEDLYVNDEGPFTGLVFQDTDDVSWTVSGTNVTPTFT